VRWISLFVVAACGHAPSPSTKPAPSSTAVAALGETITLDSKVLGEKRVINVYLPPDYAKGGTFPVLYMPDGGMKEDFPHVVGAVDVSSKNGVIRSVIVVGIENIERRKDLAGPTVVDEEKKAAPKAGGSDKFRAFLRDELKPMIAARYRTTAESAIIGESLAGLFVVETMIVEPELFDGYIAVDPSVWWNEQTTARLASTRFAQWKAAGGKRLYVANSSEGDESGIEMITTALRIQAPPVVWKYEPMPDELHLTIYPRAALRGIRWMFATP
jgi:predicted alpha/beta superfamily hydrolase